MTGATFTLSIESGAVSAALHRFEELAANPEPMLDRIGLILEESTRERFDTGTDPSGMPWEPSIRAIVEGGQTLVQYGHLRDSITHVVEGDAVEVGSAIEYAAVHQTGFEGDVQVAAQWRQLNLVKEAGDSGVFRISAHTRHMRIPQRAYLGLSADDETEVLSITTGFMAAALEGGAQ